MTVEVIIRTLAEAGRRTSLINAIDSLMRGQRCRVRPIIVINGDRFDAAVIAAVRQIAGVHVVHIVGGLQRALIAGRSAVSAPYFAFLDDDDAYLPNGVDAMLAAIEAQPEADAVVTNGYLSSVDGRQQPIISDVDAVGRAPLAALRQANWLYPSGTIFRSIAFPVDWFGDIPPLFEWTWIAYKASLSKKVRFSPQFSYRYNDTPHSLSKSFEMLVYEDDFLRELETLPLPREERRSLRRKHGAALHAISDECRRRGKRRLAAVYHVHSLLKPGGCRYLPYTRHLLTIPR
ncbi:MAG: glycosyltransferase family 2 protein [Rhodospirillales bacterium]|nr:glycosyltransferase family 2 protein [Rhodospirillales bacterium]